MASLHGAAAGAVAGHNLASIRTLNATIKQKEEEERTERIGTSDSVYNFNKDGDDTTRRPTVFELIIEHTPGLAGFLSLPTLPDSIVPWEMDCGLTRARDILYTILTDPASKFGALFFVAMMSAILVSIASFCVQSLPEYRIRGATGVYGDPEATFDDIELVCVAIFTVEYLGRFISVTAAPSEREKAYVEHFGFVETRNHPVPLSYPRTFPHFLKWTRVAGGKITRFITNWLNIIDLIAILPYYVNLVSPTQLGGSLAILRVLRLSRVLRLFKFSSRLEGVQILTATVVTALDALGFLTFFLLLATVLFGSIIFFCESGDWDDTQQTFLRPNLLGTGTEESPFKSIPHSFWWTMVTMTTTGYGDMYPTTAGGRSMGVLIMLCGLLTLALPITVIGSAFTEEYSKFKEKRVTQLLEMEQARAAEAEEEAQRDALGLPPKHKMLGSGKQIIGRSMALMGTSFRASKPLKIGSKRSNIGAASSPSGDGTPNAGGFSPQPSPADGSPNASSSVSAVAGAAGRVKDATSGSSRPDDVVVSMVNPSFKPLGKSGAAYSSGDSVTGGISGAIAVEEEDDGNEAGERDQATPLPSFQSRKSVEAIKPNMSRTLSTPATIGTAAGSGVGLPSANETTASGGSSPVASGAAVFPPPLLLSDKADRELDLLIALRGRSSRLRQAVAKAAAVKMAVSRGASSKDLHELVRSHSTPANAGIGLGLTNPTAPLPGLAAISSSPLRSQSVPPSASIVVSLAAEDLEAAIQALNGAGNDSSKAAGASAPATGAGEAKDSTDAPQPPAGPTTAPTAQAGATGAAVTSLTESVDDLRSAVQAQNAEIALLRADNAWMRSALSELLHLVRSQGSARPASQSSASSSLAAAVEAAALS